MLSIATGAAPHLDTYRALPAWQRAMDLMAACYALSRRLPERNDLALPLRHASLAVVDGIATGAGCRALPRKLQHLVRARRALREVETLLRTAYERGYLDHAERRALAHHVDETGRRLLGLTRALGATPAAHSRPPNSSASTRASMAPV
jgi:four helix bundle protein